MSLATGFARFGRGLRDYGDNLRAFHPNARLYLISAVITGATMGVLRLLRNFYALSMNYDEALIGNLVTASSLTALIFALPMGYAADFLGRKRSMILSALATALVVLLMVWLPSKPMLIGANVLLGLAQSLAGVTMGPFLMENSTDRERTYLFSIASGLGTASGFVGNWVGGYLPTWMGRLVGAAPTETASYAAALLVIGILAGLAAIPMLFVRIPRLDAGGRSQFAPLSYLKGHAGMLGKLILPMLITSIGAGLIMPFMNVFFRLQHNQPDPVIGSLFAWGSLAMAVGMLIAPPLAERTGKIQLVVITQGLSIPFLALLGFSPWFAAAAFAYYIRVGLMNMSGPVYQTFVMEKVDPGSRATVASLVSMANSFGWAFSPTISGWLQVGYGFAPAFIGTIVLYTISVFFYWYFFLHGGRQGKT
jgi:MFS family permease